MEILRDLNNSDLGSFNLKQIWGIWRGIINANTAIQSKLNIIMEKNIKKNNRDLILHNFGSINNLIEDENAIDLLKKEKNIDSCILVIRNDSTSLLDIDGKKFTDGFSLNVGNPHIVFFVKDCFENDLKILGPKIENHELFPERTNVTFAQIDDENNITVNVWERGAGLTKACGTAACATAVAAFIKKLTKNDINIKFEEGSLNIKIDADLNIFMRGPVSEIKHTSLEI